MNSVRRLTPKGGYPVHAHIHNQMASSRSSLSVVAATADAAETLAGGAGGCGGMVATTRGTNGGTILKSLTLWLASILWPGRRRRIPHRSPGTAMLWQWSLVPYPLEAETIAPGVVYMKVEMLPMRCLVTRRGKCWAQVPVRVPWREILVKKPVMN